MATRKINIKIWGLIGILVIPAWLLGFVIEAKDETMKFRTATVTTKDEKIPVSDEEGHVLGLYITEGLAFLENGEIAKMRAHVAYDSIPGKGSQQIGYTIYTFEDGSTIVVRFQRLLEPVKSGVSSAKVTSDIIKGTGRFEGIKGNTSGTGKSFPGSKGEAARTTNDVTLTYTLTSK